MTRVLLKTSLLLIIWIHHSQGQVSENYLKSIYLVGVLAPLSLLNYRINFVHALT